MQDEERPPQRIEENEQPPDDEVPDPSGPPEPVAKADPGCSLVATVLGLLAAGGFLFCLLGIVTGPTEGATRSGRLQLEQRRAEIDRAVEEAMAERQSALERPEDDR